MTVVRVHDLHQVAGQLLDLSFPQHEDVAEAQIEDAAVLAMLVDRPFGDHDVTRFDDARDRDGGTACELGVLDLEIERRLTFQSGADRSGANRVVSLEAAN